MPTDTSAFYVTGQSWTTPDSRAQRTEALYERHRQAAAMFGMNHAASTAPRRSALMSTAKTVAKAVAKKVTPLTAEQRAAKINDETKKAIQTSASGYLDRLVWGVNQTTFAHKDFTIAFTLTNMPYNCGVLILTGLAIRKKGSANRFRYVGDSFNGGKNVNGTKEEIKEVYIAFLKFLQGMNVYDRRTLLFTDAVGGEHGDNYPSLYELAKVLDLPLSHESYNVNSGNKIVSCWVHLDNDLGGKL